MFFLVARFNYVRGSAILNRDRVFFFVQPSVVMTTRLERPMLWERRGRSPIRDGWWWTARASEREAAASRAPPEVSVWPNTYSISPSISPLSPKSESLSLS